MLSRNNVFSYTFKRDVGFEFEKGCLCLGNEFVHGLFALENCSVVRFAKVCKPLYQCFWFGLQYCSVRFFVYSIQNNAGRCTVQKCILIFTHRENHWLNVTKTAKLNCYFLISTVNLVYENFYFFSIFSFQPQRSSGFICVRFSHQDVP